jgi:hypothetical protein
LSCRFEGLHWSAAIASAKFDVKVTVSNQGTQAGKVGTIKFWTVPKGTNFSASCNVPADFTATLKNDKLPPGGKVRTAVISGILAPSTPGEKTLVGYVDGGESISTCSGGRGERRRVAAVTG